MNSELKPCPFCGKNELTMGRSFVSGNKGKYKNQYYIVCSICDSKGPNWHTEKGAVNAWNRRVNDES